jgi:hypothetical protein
MHYSQNIITAIKAKRIVWASHVAGTGEVNNEGKRLLGKPSHTWEDNVTWILNKCGLNFS